MLRRWLVAVLGVSLALGALAAPASAKPAPVTKMEFKLSSHQVESGSDLTGGVSVWSRSGNEWLPLPGALLTVLIDGVEVGQVTAGADGYVDVAYTVDEEEGDHVMKVVFAGDDLHKKAQRAQGFTVVPPPPTAPEAPVLSGTGVTIVSLSWTVPADGGSPITGYNVYRGDCGGCETIIASLVVGTTFDDLTVELLHPYAYVVTAVNAEGESVWSNEFFVTPA